MEFEEEKPHTPRMHERRLIRMVQRGLAFVNMETGEVHGHTNEFTGETEYFGTLRRKLIPGHKKYEAEQREFRKKELEEKAREPEVFVDQISILDLIRQGIPTNCIGAALSQLVQQYGRGNLREQDGMIYVTKLRGEQDGRR